MRPTCPSLLSPLSISLVFDPTYHLLPHPSRFPFLTGHLLPLPPCGRIRRGYGICAGAMLTAISVFLFGTRHYRYKRCSGSPIVHILQVLVAAAQKRGIKPPPAAAALYEDRPDHARIPRTTQFPCLDRAAVMAGDDDNEVGHDGRPAPNQWRLCSVSRMEEVNMVARRILVWARTILFWT